MGGLYEAELKAHSEAEARGALEAARLAARSRGLKVRVSLTRCRNPGKAIVAEAREALGYRGVVELDVRKEADIWGEKVPVAIDPRLQDDLAPAAE